MKYLLFIISLFFITSCGHFRDEPNVSVWAGGAWGVPVVLGILGVIFLYQYLNPGKNKARNKMWLLGTGLMVVLIIVAIWYFNSPNWK